MPRDDLAGTGLDDDEIELIKARRKQRKEEDERTIRIKDGDREAEVPYSVGRNWLRKHGFDLEDESAAPEPEPEPEPDEDDDGKAKPVRFAGRRVG
jgi:hypothetical protein